MSDLRSKCIEAFRNIQESICTALETCDGSAKFSHDNWERTDITGESGGGGRTRVLENGSVFEKGGVNFSEVFGFLPPEAADRLGLSKQQVPFFATGVSLVMHPRNPMVPTTHSNWRYIEAGPYTWFGGGSDLTPYILFEEDARHFHTELKNVCERHDPNYYPRFKKWCDTYFFLPHRLEHRGIGGIFFDHLGKDDGLPHPALFQFVKDLGLAFPRSYVPIVDRRKSLAFEAEDRDFQLQRRGRYVEFNLLYDRGTQFGLSTGGRTESILMSLPPLVRWDYNPNWEGNTKYRTLLESVRQPRDWI